MNKFLILVLLIGPTTATARTLIGEGIFRKQAQKESTRWTLSDWLTQKKQFNAMDHWLALNKTMDLFEIVIEGAASEYDLVEADVEVSGKKRVERGSISLYWSIFGIQYTFEDSNEDWTRESAQFNLRVFGTSSQSTNLTAFYGARRWEIGGSPSDQVDNQYAGAKLSLYLLSFFGLEGEYRKHFQDKSSRGDEYETERIEYGGFIDVYFVRLYGSAFKETVEKTVGGTPSQDTRDGAMAGMKFYF